MFGLLLISDGFEQRSIYIMQGLVGYGSDSDREDPDPKGAALSKEGHNLQPQPHQQQQQQQQSSSQPMHYTNGGNRGGRHGPAYGRGVML